MSMSKQDFIALADTIRDHNADRHAGDVNSPPFSPGQIQALAHFCARQNQNFLGSRWLGYIAGTNGPSGKVLKT